MLTTFQNDKILKCFVTFNIQCSIFTLLNICSEESNCDNMFFKYKITFSDPPFKLSKPDKFDTWCWNSTPVLACPPVLLSVWGQSLVSGSSRLSETESVERVLRTLPVTWREPEAGILEQARITSDCRR